MLDDPAACYTPAGVMTRYLAASLALAAAAASTMAATGAASETAAAIRPPTAFDPASFFVGTTTGHGRLKKALSSEQRVLVRGRGTLRADGLLVLDQVIQIEGEQAARRRWTLRRIAPGQFRGSLTDATGPVKVTVSGAVMNISYTMKGSMVVDQVLTLAPNGQSASNRMKIRKFGITVATLRETIRRG